MLRLLLVCEPELARAPQLSPMPNSTNVCVVIPAFNEEERLGATLRGIPPWVDAVVVVDDASRDATSAVAASFDATRVHVERHAYNQGVGAAIRTGYLRALDLGADILVVMAADNQMDPCDLPTLLQPLVDGRADYAKGNRFVHPEHRAMPRLRKLGSRFLSMLTRVTTGYDVDDCQCGYTALSADTARRVAWHDLWPRYGYPNDLLALLSHVGARVVDVPVRPVYAGEHSGLHAGHVFSIARRIVWRRLTAPKAQP
jgi:glycosyltransferase involved in cell wall biosynthesis